MYHSLVTPCTTIIKWTGLLLFTLFSLSSCMDETVPLPAAKPAPFCVKEKTMLSVDGDHVGTNIYSYEGKNLVSEISFDSEGLKSDSAHFTYDDEGRPVRNYYYNMRHGVEQSEVIRYDGKGKEIWRELTINGVIKRIETKFCSETGEIDSIYLSQFGQQSMHYYSYENGRVAKIIEMNEAGEEEYVRTYTYDDGKRQERIEVKSPNGKIFFRTVIQNDAQGREIERKQFDPDGNVTLRTIREYNSNGDLVRKTEIYAGLGTYVYDTSWVCSS